MRIVVSETTMFSGAPDKFIYLYLDNALKSYYILRPDDKIDHFCANRQQPWSASEQCPCCELKLTKNMASLMRLHRLDTK